MAWTESTSASFACRHSSERAADAARVLRLLERTRERLLEHFPNVDAELTVILHDSPHALLLSNPLLPAIYGLTSRPARRYVTGWAGLHELHVLSPRALRERASSVSGSFEMLALTPASLYAKHVVVTANRELQSARLPARSWAELRWAWLVEGASRWFSGESGHARSVIGQYMRSGRRPHFPPGPRDAPLLAPPLIELLAEHEGPSGVARLVGRLHAGGSRAALLHAFGRQELSSIENEWRSRLRRLGEGG
jgi:hypothetical protein